MGLDCPHYAGGRCTAGGRDSGPCNWPAGNYQACAVYRAKTLGVSSLYSGCTQIQHVADTGAPASTAPHVPQYHFPQPRPRGGDVSGLQHPAGTELQRDTERQHRLEHRRRQCIGWGLLFAIFAGFMAVVSVSIWVAPTPEIAYDSLSTFVLETSFWVLPPTVIALVFFNSARRAARTLENTYSMQFGRLGWRHTGPAGEGARKVAPVVTMSPDGTYWWDGAAWIDCARAAPGSAPRSPDGTAWWDGVGWRPLPTSVPGPQDPSNVDSLLSAIIEHVRIIAGDTSQEERLAKLSSLGPSIVPNIDSAIERCIATQGEHTTHQYQNAEMLCEVMGKLGGEEALSSLSRYANADSNIWEYKYIREGAERGLASLSQIPRSGASRPETKQPPEAHEHEARLPQQAHEGMQAVYFPRELVENSPAAPTMTRIEELANDDWSDWAVQNAIEELDEVLRVGAPVWLSYPPINSAKVTTLSLLMRDHDPRVASTAANALWQLLLTTATPAKVALLERVASRTDTEAKNEVARRLLSDLMTSALGRALNTGEKESVTTLISVHL
jgi:hypothetical protein